MKLTKGTRPWVIVAALTVVAVALLGLVWTDTPSPFNLSDDLSGAAAKPAVESDVSAVPSGGAEQPVDIAQQATESSVQAPASPPAAIAPAPVEPAPLAQPSRSAGSILANERIVTYYGHPYDARMGILGELSQGDLIAAVADQAAAYEEISDLPVQPALHMIATVAQEDPGEDGMYRAGTPMEVMQEYADLAARNGMLFIIDVQVGRGSVQNELARLIPLLRQPNVHLALDPEFDMWGDQLPGVEIGHMTADEINYAQSILSQIVDEEGGSNKILIVHQFTPFMIADKGSIYDDPNVDLAVVMDGFGSDDLKIKHYNMFVRDELVEFGGIKLFYTQDYPLMSPDYVLSLEPVPDVIIYQ